VNDLIVYNLVVNYGRIKSSQALLLRGMRSEVLWTITTLPNLVTITKLSNPLKLWGNWMIHYYSQQNIIYFCHKDKNFQG
jgi:hypothetical protein